MTGNPLNKFCTIALLGALPLTEGCSYINYRQVAYEVLRQEDCRRNKLEDFCTRTYAKEYLEYEQLRQEFLRSQTQRTWRASRETSKQADASQQFSRYYGR